MVSFILNLNFYLAQERQVKISIQDSFITWTQQAAATCKMLSNAKSRRGCKNSIFRDIVWPSQFGDASCQFPK